MAAFFRFVSLMGVLAAGFYLLFLTQARLTDPESLTQTVSEDASPVTLGAEGELAHSPGLKQPWKTVEAGIPTSGSEFPGGLNSTEMFSASSSSTPTEVTEAVPRAGTGIDFRDENELAKDELESGLGIVRAAVARSEPEEITLTSNENPFSEDVSRQPREAENTTVLEGANPFDAQDPFDNQPGVTEEPSPKPETEPTEFDPFGEDVKTSDSFSTEKAADEFPSLERKPETTISDKKPEPATEQPDPFAVEDAFSPFGEEPSKAVDEADSQEPIVGEKPSRKPELTADPFEDAFPELPTDKTPAESTAAERTPVTRTPDAVDLTFPELNSATDRPVERKPATPKLEPVADPLDEPFPELNSIGGTPADPKPTAPKPESEPVADPFDAPFPELNSPSNNSAKENPADPLATPVPSSDPFGESIRGTDSSPATPTEVADFPAELSESDKLTEKPSEPPSPKSLENEFDPFTEKDPGPKPAENLANPTSPLGENEGFPALEPLDSPATNTPPERNRALPSLEEFSDLDEKLKRGVEQDERIREATPVVEPVPADFPGGTPDPLPSFGEPNPAVSADAENPTVPDKLLSSPTGIVPSLTDLQGDGVLTPETPRKVQLPYLEIQKSAPPKAVLNQPFVYTILVKNVGEAAANEVTVQDQIPKGANLTGTIPQAELVGRRLVWKLGRIEPGEEQKVAVRVVPIESGPIGSVATVNFVAEVGAETVVEHPELTFQMTLPRQADVGEVVECRFEIENRGTRVVSGIVLRDVIPQGLHHPAGRDLENPLGDLKPGEVISEALELKIMKPGAYVNQAVLTAEGGLQLKQEARLEARGNRLTILRRGPKERFVGRPAMFQNVVKNSSPESVFDAVVIEKLPEGMQFVQAGQGGQYHATSREIYWKIAELAAGQSVTLDSQMTPVKPGVGESLVRVRESQGKEIQTVSHTQVRSYASIGLDVTEFDQPVLVGDTVVMRIEATNRGNASAQTVQLRAKIPPTLELMSVRGKTRFRVEGREVVFETLQALSAGATEIIEMELKAAASAKAEVAVSVQSHGMAQPLVRAAAVPVHSRQ